MAKQQKKHRKYGRNKKYSQLREALGTEAKNKARRIRQHEKRMAKKSKKGR